MRASWPDLSLCRLFTILVAISMLLAPSIASATMSSSAHSGMPMMDVGHCQFPSTSSDHDKMAGKNCCIAMCMAVAVAPWVPCQAAPPGDEIAQFAAPRVFEGLPAEIATPPPRNA